MDGDFRLDISEVLRNIDTAEVLSIHLLLLRKTLIIDTRYTLEDEPLIRIVPMASSIEERWRSLRRLRPHMPRPESVTVIPWPKYVDNLVSTGIWDRIVERIVASGFKSAVRRCTNALDELRKLELEEMIAVIRGENYHTIWARSG